MSKEFIARGWGRLPIVADGGICIQRAGKDAALRVGDVAARYAEAPKWPAAAWEAFDDGGGARCLLVAVDAGDELCGWIGGSCQGGTAEIETLMVLPAMRRLGLAGRLLAAWMAWVRLRGGTECLLEVRGSNEAALRLYRRAGFAVQGRRRRYYSAPEEDALLLRVALASGEDEASGESSGV